jgi:6-carboxyhexanoate--CoA ligase
MSSSLIKRALTHPRGKPDTIILTVEEIKGKPQIAYLLSLRKLKCNSPEKAAELISSHMSGLGISSRALAAAAMVLSSEHTLRGAVLVSALSGKRLEPDKKRGIRVSRLGISEMSEKKLSSTLSALRINTSTVKEALVLASKVASCKGVIAEICISDDPDYTTGYIASKKFGYMRLTNIKRAGDMRGGRVFFVKENADVPAIMKYLQETPVLLECK